MSVLPRSPDSVYDRIATYLPAEQRESFFRYVAHLKTLRPDDELMVLAEGMALFSCIARDVPLALTQERQTLLAEFGELCRKFEKAMKSATADTRAMFLAHQKLLEQNMGVWQTREQTTVRALETAAKTFEKSVAEQNARLAATVEKVDTATQNHRTNSERVTQMITLVNWHNLAWPGVACVLFGGVAGALVVHFLR